GGGVGPRHERKRGGRRGPGGAPALEDPRHGRRSGGDGPADGYPRAAVAGLDVHGDATRDHRSGGNAGDAAAILRVHRDSILELGTQTYSHAEVESWATRPVAERYVAAMNACPIM